MLKGDSAVCLLFSSDFRLAPVRCSAAVFQATLTYYRSLPKTLPSPENFFSIFLDLLQWVRFCTQTHPPQQVFLKLFEVTDF
jgi:hypothetical protein